VNDVTALRGSPSMCTMQDDPRYDDVVEDVARFLEQRVEAACAAGVDERLLLIDPGIGFGKTLEHNLAVLRGLDRICGIGPPVLVGVSRKRFIGTITGREQPKERLAGSLGAAVAAVLAGAHVVRAHDVGPTLDALRVAVAVEAGALG
jgi:dihydropteroate synthase